ncbi:hypothetical protein M0R19_02340 [Candidatus Pacearchaeota archaeon]|nr:hypothetical protein [Candidatus Pacearchaeota archaeon]
MIKKSIDNKVLAALGIMANGRRDEGINYLEFVKANIMNGALDLIERGYAEKVKIKEEDSNYRLTDKGKKYLEKILKYASKINKTSQ